jgi:hypothetical protein
MNTINKSSIVQALGFGLAGAAAATLAGETAKRARSSRSPLGSLIGRKQNPLGSFGRTLAGVLASAPILGNLVGGKRALGRRLDKRDLLRGALLGLSVGAGALAKTQRRGLWGMRGRRVGSGMGTLGRVLAGGLVAAAASRLLNRTLRDRYENEPHTHEIHTRGRQVHDQPGI